MSALKNWCKSKLPPSLWEYARSFTYSSRFFGLIFTSFVRTWRLRGLTLVYPKHLVPLSQRALFLFGGYESAEFELSSRHILASDSVLELGGCLGVVSCGVNRLLADRSRQLVVEANPYLLPTIYANRRLNQAGFRVLNAAVGTGPIQRFALQRNIHASTVSPDDSGRDLVEQIELPSFSIAELATRFGPFTVLVADIEGAEFPIFRQEAASLAAFRLIILETHPNAYPDQDLTQLESILTGAGFHRLEELGPVQVWQRIV